MAFMLGPRTRVGSGEWTRHSEAKPQTRGPTNKKIAALVILSELHLSVHSIFNSIVLFASQTF